jgi:tetratricopeptide (TPR) repeat protein
VAAIGSGSKSPEEKARELEKDARKEYNKGVEHMEKAREKAAVGDSAFAYNYRATSDAKAEKEYRKAIKRFNKAVEKRPEMKEAHNNLGYCYRKIGDLESSLEAYSAALAIDSTFAQAREYLGETYLAMDSLPAARSELAYLETVESPYADTLRAAIDLYRLRQIESRMDN